MNKALVVVDVQQFFLYDAPDELPQKIADHIQSNSYDTIAFTVFKNTPDSNFVRSLNWSKCDRDEDARLPDEFKPYIATDNVFERATFSGFSGTGLDEYLRDRHIKEITICGVDTDACVLGTAFSAFDNGYLINVDFNLTYSGGGLEREARAIFNRSLLNRD
jgi:nicotinamidase-related amidase